MAQKVEITLVDDLDGNSADETVRFALDGVNYEIDLSDANAAALRGTLEHFIAKGRRVAGRPVRAPKAAAPARSNEVGLIRAWAKSNGYPVRDRGRIQAEIREAYYAAQG
ncbi:histone-like nucleoid-structuring protein Lsr2 [Arthrobacter sp. 35W]|uniref:histone-like nucleoid-structuring protein Lsr2 n=1 Tax=Arthrobacter sp. 35W TaxID=1132441 RepID=UPI00040600B9|nr:Lsr2 family protein [Arthrobacter sp. 35W]